VKLACACPQSGAQLSPAAEAVVGDAACSRSIDLQQRALEIQALIRCVYSGFRFLDAHCSASSRPSYTKSEMHAAPVPCADLAFPNGDILPGFAKSSCAHPSRDSSCV